MTSLSKPKIIHTPMEEEEEARDVLGSSANGRFFANLALEGYGRRVRGAPGTLTAASRTYSLDDEWSGESDGRPRSASSAANLIVLRKASRPMSVEILGQLDGAENSLRQFLATQTLYDLLPHIGKVVVLDTSLQIRRAFVALMETGVRAAPLWDSTAQQPIALLTYTDFLRMLAHAHAHGVRDPDLHSIHWWLELQSQIGSAAVASSLISLGAEDSLLKATSALVSHGVHRAPVRDVDSGELLGFASLKEVLRILHRQIRSLPLPSSMRLPIRTLSGKLGTWNQLRSTTPESRLSEAVDSLLKDGLSSLPVLDTKGRLSDVLTKADIINLLNEEASAALKVGGPRAERHLFKDLLGLSVTEALERRVGEKPLSALPQTESLLAFADRLSISHLRSLYVLDEAERPIGVVSLTDLMRSILDLSPKRQSSESESESEQPRSSQPIPAKIHF